MMGANIVLPFLTMMVGALLAMRIGGPNGLVWGAAIGFGVGCAVMALVWLLFVILKKMAE